MKFQTWNLVAAAAAIEKVDVCDDLRSKDVLRNVANFGRIFGIVAIV